MAAEGHVCSPPVAWPPYRDHPGSAAAAGGKDWVAHARGRQRPGTWKQEGHMVMEASGSRERKYCHCRGGGQRLMRTSRRLMERSTERFTTTGTNSEPPCCSPGGESGRGLAQPAGGQATPQRTPEPSPACPVPRENPAGRLCDREPASFPRGPQGGVCRAKGPEPGLGVVGGVSAASHTGVPAPRSSAWP